MSGIAHVTSVLPRGDTRIVVPDDAGAVTAAILGAVGTTGEAIAPYGAGDAAARILARLLKIAG